MAQDIVGILKNKGGRFFYGKNTTNAGRLLGTDEGDS
jgi:hypothetical protein